MTKITTRSKLYNRLARTNKTFSVRTETSTQAGVLIESNGSKKRVNIELILPSTDTDGSDRMVKVNMTGRQARAIYETLTRHYERENNSR